MAYETISEVQEKITSPSFSCLWNPQKHLALPTLHLVGTELNFKFGCVTPKSHFRCNLTKFLLRSAQPGDPGYELPFHLCSVGPMSKESYLFVSRNLLYHMAGDLPPLRIMKRDVVTSRVGITVKPVYCIHLVLHLQAFVSAYYKQMLCWVSRMQWRTKEKVPQLHGVYNIVGGPKHPRL